MLFASLNIQFKQIRWEIVNSVFAAILVFVWYNFTYVNRLQIDTYLPFGTGINPPSVSLIVYGILIIWLLWSLFSLMIDCNIRIINSLAYCFCRCGKYSLYIFLYHMLILRTFLININIHNRLLLAIVYYGIMVFVPIAGKVMVKYVANIIIIKYKKSQAEVLE